MKFKFKIQQYQTDAVNAVINVFKGQPFNDKSFLFKRFREHNFAHTKIFFRRRFNF